MLLLAIAGYLVLGGGGGGAFCDRPDAPPACEEHIDEFVRLAGGPKASIVIIPTAAFFDEAPRGQVPRSWYYVPLQYDDAFRERFAAPFRKRGVTNIRWLHTMHREQAGRASFAAPIATATAVWMIGGRQWMLADIYGGTRTEAALHDLLARGGVIGGYSASAVIQGSFLVRGDSRGNIPIESDHERGFGFLENAAVDVHVLAWNRQFDLVPVIRKHPELLGIGIDADAAIVVHGDEFRVIGVGDVAIYDPKIVADGGKFYFLEPGERFNLASRSPVRPASIRRFLPAAQSHAPVNGTYRFDDLTIAIAERDGRVIADFGGGDERELQPVSEREFVDAVSGSRVTFHDDSLQWEWPRCTMLAQREVR